MKIITSGVSVIQNLQNSAINEYYKKMSADFSHNKNSSEAQFSRYWVQDLHRPHCILKKQITFIKVVNHV